MLISRKNFKKDVQKILTKLEILEKELQDCKEKGIYGNIGNIEIYFKSAQQVFDIIKNYKLPWYKISVECDLNIFDKKYTVYYLESVKKKRFLDGFQDQTILFFCGLPLAFMYIIYETTNFIYKKIIYILY